MHLLVVMIGNNNIETESVSSVVRAVSRLHVNVTDDAEYVCRWSTVAGAADDLTCVISLITGNSPAGIGN